MKNDEDNLSAVAEETCRVIYSIVDTRRRLLYPYHVLSSFLTYCTVKYSKTWIIILAENNLSTSDLGYIN